MFPIGHPRSVAPSPLRTVLLGGSAADRASLLYNENAPSGLLASTTASGSWLFSPDRTNVLHGSTARTRRPDRRYNVTRNYVSHVRSGCKPAVKHTARIDASVPLANMPELLSAYWRTDFDRNPTTTNANGDAVADWALAERHVRHGHARRRHLDASGALETRPLNDFTTVTTVEVRCRNTTVGGNGAVAPHQCRPAGRPVRAAPRLRATASRRHANATLYGKSSDAATKKLFDRSSSAERLRPVPAHRSCRKTTSSTCRSTTKTKARLRIPPTPRHDAIAS